MRYNADSKHLDLAYFKPANSNRSHNWLNSCRILPDANEHLVVFDKGRMIEYLRQDVHAETLTITKKGCRKTAPPQSIHPTIKLQLFDFDTTRSRNFLLLNTLRQRNVKHTVHHLSLNGIKVDVFRKSKALMV